MTAVGTEKYRHSLPEKIGKYEIRQLLGEGTTSQVFLAYDSFTQNSVALKYFHPEMLRNHEKSQLYRHLMMNEVALVGKLNHPHIVHIFDAVQADDEAYIVMEYVAGGTLEAYSRPQRLLPFNRLTEIIFKATRALDYAFHRGITHRDIKPANIMLVDSEGQDIKLTDFGIALNNASEATQIIGVGSPGYMSPQQIRDMHVDHRADIYSLGVVMYQLLTGHLPFESQNGMNLMYRIIHDTPPQPCELRPEIPEALNTIVLRAMEKELERRYQTWVEFSHDLAQAFHNTKLNASAIEIPDTEKFETLRKSHFFQEFTDVEIWEVVNFSQWRRTSPGTTIIREGEQGSYFCLLGAGEACVKKQGKLLHMLTEGDCFGEMAMFSSGGSIRSASVEAMTQVNVITIEATALNKASDTCRMHFYKSFLKVLSTRLSLATSRIANT